MQLPTQAHIRSAKSLLLALLFPAIPLSQAGILFEDTFDRPDNRNISAVLDGITNNTGTTFLPGAVYSQPFLDPNNAAPTYGVQDGVATNGGGAQILANNLQLAVGAGTSNAFVNHNFTNAAIPAAGGFSVSLDVLTYTQATNGQGASFAIGMTQAEAASTRDSFSGAARMTGGFGVEPGAAIPAANVSDFWVVVRGNNSLAWGGKSGTVQGATGLSSKVGTIAANFRFTDFNAGSTVNYEVLIDGIIKGTGTFTWSDNASNYIGLDVRDAVLGSLDNFRVATDFVQPLFFAPQVTAFETTRLAGTPNTRFHWRVKEGTLNDPVAITIRNGNGTTVHTTGSLTGFADVNTTGSTDFTLTAVNTEGEHSRDTTLVADDALSTAIRSDAPALWYRFNEASGSQLIVDSAGNAVPHYGSVTGNTTTGLEGPRDGVALFEGTGSILTDLTLDPAATAAGHTIEAFVRRFPGSPANSAIVSQNDGSGTGRSHLAVHSDGTIQTFLAGGPAQRKDADVKLAASNWAHVVMVVDKTVPEIRWYLDGVPIGTSADGTNPDGSTFDPALTPETTVGAWRIGTQKLANQNFWLGEMDDLVIYDKVLAAARITAHKDAWLASASGLLSVTAANETIAPGGSTTITVKAGSDVTSASISPGGALTFVNGVATLVVSPTETTTYTITVNGPFGTQTLTITVTVETTPPTETLTPVITSAAVDGSGFRIKFTGSANTAYRVRGSLDLGAFTIDHGNPTTDGAGLGEVVVPLVSGEKAHFYRVEKTP